MKSQKPFQNALELPPGALGPPEEVALSATAVDAIAAKVFTPEVIAKLRGRFIPIVEETVSATDAEWWRAPAAATVRAR